MDARIEAVVDVTAAIVKDGGFRAALLRDRRTTVWRELRERSRLPEVKLLESRSYCQVNRFRSTARMRRQRLERRRRLLLPL
jgi:hypothetical protein